MELDILNYAVRKKAVKQYGGSCWNGSIMEVVYKKSDGFIEVLGEYERNYPNHESKTFAPFLHQDKVYALYSPHYTCTRIMSLPECKDIGGEDPKSNGFCPVDLWVPLEVILVNDKGIELNGVTKYYTTSLIDHDKNSDDDENEINSFLSKINYYNSSDYHYLATRSAPFGFVAGCVWGDDSSWKLERFDLSKAHEGILTRECPWGYLELPHHYKSLRKHVSLERGVYIGKQGEKNDCLDKQLVINRALENQFFFMDVETRKSIHLNGKEVKVFDEP